MTRFVDVELIGSKVKLRPIHPDDASVAYDLVRDDRVTSMLLWDGPSNLAELIEGYRLRADRWKQAISPYVFGIDLIGKSSIIGSIDARYQEYPGQWEIGYWLGVPHWGNGYMTEAVRLITHFAFKHLDAVRVCADPYVGNIASSRVLEKNGFQLDGTLRSHVLKRGEYLDQWYYTLLRTEWDARRDSYAPERELVVPR